MNESDKDEQQQSATESTSTEDTPTEGEAAAAEAEATGEPTLEEALAAAKAEAEEMRDQFMRAKAESENIRRRAEGEVTNARKYALEGFAGELLAVRDSLGLASGVDISSGDPAVLKQMQEGLQLTLKQLDAAFDKFSISVVDPKGEKFDPEKHQAVSMLETADVEANHIIDVIQKGYLINDRLLRPAMVVVAKAPAADAPAGSPAEA